MANDFVALESVDAEERVIDIKKHPIAFASDAHGVKAGLKDSTIAFFASPRGLGSQGQPLLGFLAVVDVLVDGDVMQEASLGIMLRGDGDSCPEEASVLADIPFLPVGGFDLTGCELLEHVGA